MAGAAGRSTKKAGRKLVAIAHSMDVTCNSPKIREQRRNVQCAKKHRQQSTTEREPSSRVPFVDQTRLGVGRDMEDCLSFLVDDGE